MCGLGFEIVADPNASNAPSLPTPSPSGWQRILKSSKVIAASAVAGAATLISIVYMIGLTVSYCLGKLTPDLYWTKLQVVGGGLTAAWTLLGLAYVGGTAYEDGQQKAGPKSISVASSDASTADPK